MTFSIVALDARTGRVGAAVAAATFAVGATAVHVRAGAGAVVAQGGASHHAGNALLNKLAGGASPEELVEKYAGVEAHAGDQVAVLRIDGRLAAFTGSECEPYAGHAAATAACTQGVLLASGRIPQAMLDAFDDRGGRLEAKLAAALRAGQDLGGDVRGQRSAALMVVPGDPSAGHHGGPGDPYVDLRVDDDVDAVGALARLVVRHEANEYLLRSAAPGRSDEERAEDARAAFALAPDDPLLRVGVVVVLSRAGARDEAEPIIDLIVAEGAARGVAARLRYRADVGLEPQDANFWWLLRRLEKAGP
ncbi:MAG: hypothetical protein JWL83_197 [Actinomycetia bacterium]|nr:hypothetical protein [Actinomycetes bacterium]